MADLDLSSRYITDYPRHGTFPSLPEGAVIKPCGLCDGCSQAGTAGHETVASWLPGTTPGAEYRLHLSTLRLMQWLVWHSAARHGLIGWTPGWQPRGAVGYNYADAVGWTLIGCTSDTLTLQAGEGIDPRRLWLWAGISPEPEIGIGSVTDRRGDGIVEPNDVVQFAVPSVLALRSRPTVVQITACDVSARTVTVRVDRDVSNALATVGGVGGPVAVSTWREASDRPKWLEAPTVEPDPTGIRCRWARRDYSGSVGNMQAPDGVTVNDDDEHWYCAMRCERIGTMTDANNDGLVDKWVYEDRRASGAATFPPDGRCSQTDCDRYEPVATASWRTRDDAGQVFQQILGGVDTKLARGFGALPGAWVVQRVDTPGALPLLGLSVSLTAPVEFMATGYDFWRVGGHGEAVTYTDGTGEHVRVKTGHGWDVHGPCSVASPPGAGSLGTVAHHDALEYDDPRDVSPDQAQHPERLGLRWGIDTGDRAGRSVARWSHAEAENAPIVVPRVPVAPPDVGLLIRYCGEGVGFVRLSTPIDGWGGFVHVSPIRQPDKAEASFATRTVRSVTADEGFAWTIELENVTWSTTINETTYTWKAGGGDGCPAPVWLTPVMRGVAIGSPDGGAMDGDAVSFSTDAASRGVAMSDRRFVVERVMPHGGSSAAGFGGTVAPVVLASDYDPHALKRDVVILIDESGAMATVQPGDTMTFWRSAVACLPVDEVKWTAYGTDAWAAIDGEAWQSDHSAGRVWIAEAWFDARSLDPVTEVCLKI